MGSSLYNRFAANSPMSMLKQLKSNPFQFLLQRRINIPQDIQNDPRAIVQHLLDSGQMTQAQYNSIQSKISSLK